MTQTTDTRRTATPAWFAGWRRRHRHPASLALHLVGIPMTLACIPLAIVQLSRDQWDLWWRPVALLAGGYALQWIGHLIEGNDMGEIILIKKRLGRSYVAVSPKYAARQNNSQAGESDSQRERDLNG